MEVILDFSKNYYKQNKRDNYITIKDEEIIEASKTSFSMSEASSKVGIHFNTFARHAKRLGVYKPNQGNKGKLKPRTEVPGKILLQEILDGKHPQYQTFKLKKID